MSTTYQAEERARQTHWRETCPDLPVGARTPGTFDGRAHGWLLPAHLAEHNLLPEVRDPLLRQFRTDDIAWHDGDSARYGVRSEEGPSPNLMDSQVACLNFWWGLAAAAPQALLEVVQTFAPDATQLVPPVEGGTLLQPEWMGLRNYLGERGRRGRGRYATSADLLLTWLTADSRRHGALIESKYSECYIEKSVRISGFGTDRVDIYQSAADQSWSPFRSDLDLGELMFEPFDQHMRQQLLAAAMEAHGELDLTSVRVVHVSPSANRPLHENITAPSMRGHGDTVGEAWSTVLRRPERYQSVSYETLYRLARRAPNTHAWAHALHLRYGWAR